VLPENQWSVYPFGAMVAIAEAGIAEALFALTLFGLCKRKA
jgi:hypothetical protein